MHCSNQLQRSRLIWLKKDDANSKFFHGLMSSRRRVNALSYVVVNNVVVEGVHGIREAMFNHFENHFRSFNSISGEDAYHLERLFDEEKVKQAVWECDSLKSPGPDGVNFGFIKEFWADVKGDFMRFLLEFYANSRLVKGSNCTFIVLIPKAKSVIDKVISETQSTFIKGRQILDGILIANEAVDDVKKRKKELLLFKVDFEKAYDSVEWDYLDSVMGKMGFSEKWRRWIMTCVSSATASVLVNGSPTNEFKLGRGLRQGDPLPPFLFLIAAEGLNVMLKASVPVGLYKGYQVGSDVSTTTRISHLQFADDTLIVGEKSWANIRVLKANFILFELISGLKVNFHKSLLVGVNISEAWLVDAARVLNCKLGRIPFLYPGLPIGGDERHLSFWSGLWIKFA
ncbi:cysteine-rich receptor-like protein kinase, partial [Trifolium medium]|nr:cysteine-rich receptor-like protein kinase [Trifolium medium]